MRVGIGRTTLRLLSAVENRISQARFERRQRNGLGKLQIMPYIGYGTPDQFVLRGRVLRDKAIREPMDTASTFHNLVDMYKRFRSDEIPGSTVRARFADRAADAVTDPEGYFELRLQPGDLPPAEGFTYLVDLELVDYPGKALNPVEPTRFHTQAQVIVPPPDAQFGVISDVDDTVLRSNVTNWLTLARNTFLENAHTRLPFEGVAQFYQALRRGASGRCFNPIFYVSSSAWNIYDVLRDFMVVRDIPLGALFLTAYNLDETTFILQNQRRHKLGAIETVLRTYPDLPFILMGDSSEQDPLIYREVVQTYPARIQTIYIRTAPLSRSRDAHLQQIVREVEALGVPMVLAKDSYTAAQHAADHGYIHPDSLPAIHDARNQDRTPT